MKYSYAELAGMIDHALLHPTLTDDELRAGCDLARRYGVASVCVKPYAVGMARDLLAGSQVAVGCVVAFPHGSAATEAKRYETELACRDGAVEIDMVVNVGKALTGDWEYVAADIGAVVAEAHRRGAIVKVIFENDFLPSDETKIRLCGICARAGADFVKTSTGFGFVRGADGRYGCIGATAHDLALMRAHCPPAVRIKASGGVRDLDGLIAARDLGCARCGMSATAAVLDEYLRRNGSGSGKRYSPK